MARAGQALTKAKNDNDVLKKANTALTRDVTNLRRDNDELKKANETMTQEKNAMEESVGGNNEELTALTVEVAALKSDNVHAKAQITDLKSKRADVQSQFGQMSTDLKEAQRNLKAIQESRPEVDEGAFLQMKTDLEEAQRALKEHQDSNADDTTVGHATHSDEDFNKLQTSHKVLTTSCKELSLRNKELTEALEMAHEALKEGGKFSPKEVSKSIVEKIDAYVKGDAYREWKFVQGKAATDRFMAEVFKHVVAALPTMDTMGHDDFCSREDFMRIYTQHSCKKQRDRRQYSQTLMFKALVRKSTLCWMAPKLVPMKHLTSLFFSLRLSKETRIHPYCGGNRHSL